MIVYDIICERDHRFEAWFRNSDDFCRQRDGQLISCPVCGSNDIRRALVKPRLLHAELEPQQKSPEKHKHATPGPDPNKAYLHWRTMPRKLHEFVEKNFDDVGADFADEARAMHYGEKDERNIRGTASSKEVKDLHEEGINAMPLPEKPVEKKKLN